ncbi:MAG: NAD+ synthase [Candidatus Nitronauta litoralis]|uniref:Glutamine-dependent NAD(+) synthetase n=1 Tax=Candidatus Nitronauta litoralis TaxID=2705533 RepID=A0A7T0BWH9_9BACT|nr:MAG: NAD+ synthase [Candidatus Nitronauta litoralis]
MKFALAQVNPTIGDLEGNVEKIREAIEKAAEGQADCVLFPEMAVSGYPCRDLLDKPEFIQTHSRVVQQLIQQTRGPAVLLGHFDESQSETGKRLVNCATLFQDGRVLARHEKILLPAYDVFDELRYFQSGDAPVVATLNGMRIGITICEDIWNVPGFYDRDCYTRQPVTELVESGIDCLVNLSASPYRLGRGARRQELGRAIVKETGVPLLLVNQVGGNDDLLFDGHSYVLDADGKVLAQSPGFQEDLLVVDLNQPPQELTPWTENTEEEMFMALTLGVRDYLNKCGYKRAVIGLSGGIDSSVVAVLAAEALGAENVTGISMPSSYTATASKEDAEALARSLAIRFETIPILPLFEQYKETLRPLFGEGPEDVTEENIQARIRGNLLMAVSNKWGSMVLSTGNKSEMSVGYCTLYGDMAGGLSVLSDVLKTRVYQLARWINRNGEVIPQRVIDRPPTAELRPDQTDQDSLPPYETLDAILESYIERHLSLEEIVAQGHDSKLVSEITSKVDNNEYKRNQAAPGLKVTGKAFGSGRRIPIAQRFRKKSS